MAGQPSKADIELYGRFQKSPILFVEKMWGLIPQPVKPAYESFVASCIAEADLEKIEVKHFLPFKKGEHITWQQWKILLAVELALQGKASRRISVVSGHGTGKSCDLAWLILWFLFCFKDAQIPCTAPTSNQMHDILWKELSLWHKRMPVEVGEKYDWSTEYMRIKESPETWFARARTASKENSEALAGVHGDHVMALVDEASGVDDAIFSTAEGALTGPNVIVIMISNGTRLVGYFYDSHHNDADSWQTLSFDSEESPIVDHSFIERIEKRHGRDSDEFKIRVSGGFPNEEGVDDQGYVPLLTEADLRESPDPSLKGSIKLGVDPAGDGGDAMAQVARDSFTAKVTAYEKLNTPKTIADRAVTTIKAHDIDGDNVAVDNFGIGANVTQEIALADQKQPIRVNGVNVGDDAEDSERFFNKRAEIAWRMREWIKAGGTFYQLAQWQEELLSLRYRRTTGKNSKIQLMDKRTMKKLGLNHGKSPNRVDALMLTFNKKDEAARKPYIQPEYEPQSQYEG